MAQESELPGVTELRVRMDCNGCVHRIKKALLGVEGIYQVQVDFPQQKLTVIGRASLEMILKAVKKTRKLATVCSHTEPGSREQPPAAEPAPASGNPPAPQDAANLAPTDSAPPAEAAAAPPAEEAKDPVAPEDKAEDVKPSPEAADAATSQPEGPPAEAKDVGEIGRTIHHNPRDHVHQGHWTSYPSCDDGVHYGVPYHVIQSYSRYTPSAYTSECSYLRPAPQNARYIVTEPYNDDYYRSSRSSEGNNIVSMFSDENPNACTIV